MRLAGRILWIVRVLMVLVMGVGMLVFHLFMGVRMLMAFAEVEIDAKTA